MSDQPSEALASRIEVQNVSSKANSSIYISLAALIVSIISAYFGYLNSQIASNSLSLSEKDRERTERAYLSIDNERLLRFKVGHSIKWSFQVRNMGHTPAFRASFVSRWQIRTNEAHPHSIDNDLKLWREDENAASINEYYSKSVFTTSPLTQEQYDLLKLGQYKLELRTAVRYLDVFGKTHTTRLCAIYGKFSSGEWSNGRCKSGNNSD